MADRELQSIEIEGYASIRSARVGLGRLNVLIGANGAGKSNFGRVFELLGRLVEEDLGFLIGVNGGASALLHTDAAGLRTTIVASSGEHEAVLEPAGDDELIFAHELVGWAVPVEIGRATGRRGSTRPLAPASTRPHRA